MNRLAQRIATEFDVNVSAPWRDEEHRWFCSKLISFDAESWRENLGTVLFQISLDPDGPAGDLADLVINALATADGSPLVDTEEPPSEHDLRRIVEILELAGHASNLDYTAFAKLLVPIEPLASPAAVEAESPIAEFTRSQREVVVAWLISMQDSCAARLSGSSYYKAIQIWSSWPARGSDADPPRRRTT